MQEQPAVPARERAMNPPYVAISKENCRPPAHWRARVARQCAADIRALLKRRGASVAETCRIDAEIGARYQRARAALAIGEKGMEAWVAENLPEMSWREVQHCSSFHGMIDEFEPANAWYIHLTPAQHREGWVVADKTGARYGVQVIKLHKRWLNNEGPPPRKPPRDTKVEKDRRLSVAVEEKDAAITLAIAAEQDALRTNRERLTAEDRVRVLEGRIRRLRKLVRRLAARRYTAVRMS